MYTTVLTVLIASAIGIVFAAVVAKLIIDRKHGKHVCSCGGNCASCGICHTDKK